MLSQLLFQNAERMKLIKCDCALMNPASYCSRIPSCQVEKWEIVPFMLLVSTVSNAEAHLFIKGMNNDKLIITQRVNPSSINMHTDGDVGTWDTSYFLKIGWIVRNKYMKG